MDGTQGAVAAMSSLAGLGALRQEANRVALKGGVGLGHWKGTG